jgi:CO/xanthine dehydrogenase FAD-binding subunit
MDTPLNQIIIPASFQELFSAWNHFPEAVLYAGGTGLTGGHGKNIFAPSNGSPAPVFICLDKIEDMHRITRTEQYLEIGAMIKLNRLLHLGKIVPEVFRACLENIAGFQVRNIATIGGNICSTKLLDLPAPLTAFDAQYELRNALGTRWVSAARFHSKEEPAQGGKAGSLPSNRPAGESSRTQTVLENQELLTRIRLPLYQWDYSTYKKFHSKGLHSLVFLAKAQKNILSDIRVVYKTHSILRNKDGEAILNGKKLPLSRKTADDFVANWKEFLSDKQEEAEFSKNTLLNSIEDNVYNLSE